MTLAVLLLEDSALDAELVEANLQELGQSLELTRVDSRESFERALGGRRWDLILADYNIPGFDGTEALATARERSPDAPFLFVTGAVGEERAIELLKLGATDFVLKDRLDRLGTSVQRALRESQQRIERKRAEDALQESERTLATLMGNMPGMAFRCHPSEPWVFAYASAGARELTGYAPEDFYAGGPVTWGALIASEDRERFAAESRAALEARTQLTTRYRIRTREGAEKWVWDRSVGIHDGEGKLVFLEGFVTDVTQQILAEEEMRRRVEFEQQLIGIVSHDLRNPLNAILLAATGLLRREELDDKVTRSLVRIQSAGDRAARMIRDLLDFTQARLGGGIPLARKSLDLRELARQVIDEAEASHPERRIALHHEGDTAGEWDPDRLAQALANLVTNALRHAAEGSEVTVRVLGGEEHAGDGELIIEVHNHGAHIPPELRVRLFQPMQRGDAILDRASRSVGLGLYIVDQIIRSHRGRVEVDSSPESGTTFRIRLPRLSSQ